MALLAFPLERSGGFQTQDMVCRAEKDTIRDGLLLDKPHGFLYNGVPEKNAKVDPVLVPIYQGDSKGWMEAWASCERRVQVVQ